MTEGSFSSLAVVLAVAFGSRMLIALIPKLRVPGVVAEIVLGIVVGPQLLNWARVDDPVKLLSTIGVIFLLFLAGMELDVKHLRGELLHVAARGFGVSVVLAWCAGLVLSKLGVVQNPLLVSVILTSTALGLVLPVLKEAEVITLPLGQLIVAGSTFGEFGAVIALSLLFSRDTSSTGSRLLLLSVFGLGTLLLGWSIKLAELSKPISNALQRLQDTTAQIRIRAALLLVVALVTFAQHNGLESILAAFVAGAVVSIVDRDSQATHRHFRVKLDAIGHGFLVPIFFVASGVRFDLRALIDQPTVMLRVPILVVALAVSRAAPALTYRSLISRRDCIAAGLLQATSLPFIVTATAIGVATGALDTATAAALVAAGLTSVIVFPALAASLLKGGDHTCLFSLSDSPTEPHRSIYSSESPFPTAT